MRERTTELRRELSEVSTPLSERRNVFIRETADEAATIRAYALTGEESFLDRYRTAHAEAEAAADELREMTSVLDEEQEETVTDLLQARQKWIGANEALASGEMSVEEFRDRLLIQQERFDALLEAERRFDQWLTRTVQERRASIQRIENQWTLLSAVLALLSILVLGAALWMGRRLKRASRRISEQAEEQADLFRITQLLNRSTNLDGALRRITSEVVDLADAQGAYLEQIDFQEEKIEIVSTAGRGSPPPGTKVPYPGSLAEEVITRGEPELTTVDQVCEEGRPIGEYLSRSCPGCQLLVVPLISEDAALGALLLSRPAGADPFETSKIASIRVMADMAAFVLRRLYQIDETRRNEEALRQRTRELSELKRTLEARVDARTEEARFLASELALSEQRERHRIANLLHDDLQQQLYGVRLDLGVLRRHMEAEQTSTMASYARRIGRAVKHLEEVIATMRRRAIGLSPPVLEGEGLVETLGWLQGHVEERFGLKVAVTSRGDLTVPQTGMRVLLFQIVRELLFSAGEHAPTDRVSIRLEEKEGTLIIELVSSGEVDDEHFLSGKAFLKENAQERHRTERVTGRRGHREEHRKTSTQEGASGSRMQLDRMRGRLRLFGGQVEVDPSHDDGVRVTITVPVESLHRTP